MQIVFDPQSPLQVRLPNNDPLAIALGAAYSAREHALPAAERLLAPSLALLDDAVSKARTAADIAHKSEDDRFQASTQYDRALAEAKPLLDNALVHLKSKYIANLELLRDWGLEVVRGSRGLSVRKPKSDKGWEQFLLGYTTQESSLPAVQQISQVPLTQLTSLAQTVQTTSALRLSNRAKREGGVQTRTAETERLLDLLKACLAVLIVTRYNGKIHNDLQLWGFDVAAAGSQPGGAPSGGGATA